MADNAIGICVQIGDIYVFEHNGQIVICPTRNFTGKGSDGTGYFDPWCEPHWPRLSLAEAEAVAGLISGIARSMQCQPRAGRGSNG